MITEIINSTQDLELPDKIISAISSVFDPEIPYNVYEIGLIYKIDVSSTQIKILMTLTSPNCPEAQTLPENILNAVENTMGIETIIEITFEPSWTLDNLSDEIKLKMGLL